MLAYFEYLLCVLESAFAGRVEEADKMFAAHVTHFVDAIVSKRR